MWAMRRRITILLIIFGVFFVIFGIPYLYTHREIPTCYDKKQNQTEEGVDCGGPCKLVCAQSAKGLTSVWTRVFTIRPGMYDIVSYFENPNFTAAIPQLDYVARLYDANDTVIAEKKGSTYVNANERFAIFEGGVRTGETVAVRGEVEIAPGYQWVRVGEPQKMFTIVERTLQDIFKRPRLNAVLQNDLPVTFRDIEVTTVVYDKSDNPIGSSATKVEKLDPKGSENIFFTWPMPFDFQAETETCESPVDVMLLLDRSGSMRSESVDPPQPFTRVREATASFLDFLSGNKDQVGLVSFATQASVPIDQLLTNDLARAKRKIQDVQMGTDGTQYTNTGEALRSALVELESTRVNLEARRVIVLLTDGEAMEPNRPKKDDDPEYAKRYAMEVAEYIRRSEIALYSIGLGINANGDFLRAISTTPEHFYSSPTVADLKGVYKQIATAICKKGPSKIEIIPRVNTIVPIGL
jgi:hypothetical protein